jgi:hypothetical protein
VIRRLRSRVPVLVAWGGLLTVAACIVEATEPVTRSQMEAFVYRSMASVISIAVLFGAGAIAWLLARDRDISGKRFDTLAESVERVLSALASHDENPRAHGVASDRNHDPIHAELSGLREVQSEIAERLGALLAEHHVIRANEDALCTMLQRRDPTLSPHPRRASDPEDFDGRALRGKK